MFELSSQGIDQIVVLHISCIHAHARARANACVIHDANVMRSNTQFAVKRVSCWPGYLFSGIKKTKATLATLCILVLDIG